jgi:hypothetical protein
MTKQATKVQIDEVDGSELFRIAQPDGQIEYLITNPTKELRIDSTGEDALREIMDHWKRIHTKAHSKWRGKHFKEIKAKVKEMKKREDDKQEKMFDKDDAT